MESDPTTIPEATEVSAAHLTPPPVITTVDDLISDQFQPLDPRNIRLEQIAGLIFAAVMLIGVLFALMVIWLNVGLGWILSVVAAASLLIVFCLFVSAWRWPPIVHRYASWRLDTEGLEIRRGVLWRHQITIPLGRVQHADVSQGPFQRFYDLGTLTVHTAGTQNASVEVQGLSHATAIALRDLIVRQRKDQNVV